MSVRPLVSNCQACIVSPQRATCFLECSGQCSPLFGVSAVKPAKKNIFTRQTSLSETRVRTHTGSTTACVKRKRATLVASYKRGKAVDSQGVFIYGADLTPGTRLHIPHSEQNHLRARRLGSGSVVRVLDGDGRAALAEVSEDFTHATVLEAAASGTSRSLESPLLAVCYSVPKSSSRADWAVEKLTETGADELLFVQTERSVNRDPPSLAKHQRWSRLSVAAVKQSMRLSVPQLRCIGGMDELCRLVPNYGGALLLSPDGIPIIKAVEKLASSSPLSMLIVAGPEGGFTNDEELRLASAGCLVAGLGNQRLRIETAVVAACCAVRFFYDYKYNSLPN
jgi:16S rRNA (uracil1498-N3)-methyltransferase